MLPGQSEELNRSPMSGHWPKKQGIRMKTWKRLFDILNGNQKHLGADVDYVWEALTGRNGGFKELDQAMKTGDPEQKYFHYPQFIGHIGRNAKTDDGIF